MENIEVSHSHSHADINSNVLVGGWHGVTGENTVADAVVDQIVYGAHRLELRGESLRKRANVNRESLNS